MNSLIGELSDQIREFAQSSVLQLAVGSRELRAVFHGPPLSILRGVFARLVSDGGINVTVDGSAVTFPVLLQVAALDEGATNPPIGESGFCNEDHLLDLRNSPDCPRYVALVPPGRQRNLSVTSASTDFGLSGDNNSGNATTEDWWSDAFVQELVDIGLRRSGLPTASVLDAKRLVEEAVKAADIAGQHDIGRSRAWNVLGRLFSIPRGDLAVGTQISLACGFPPCADGGVHASEQISCLDTIANVLGNEGFRPGLSRLSEGAAEADEAALNECRIHLQSTCDIPTIFERAPSFFYGPANSGELLAAPVWWQHLTVERWTELLEGESQPPGSLLIECTNSLFPRMQGVDAVVAGEATIKVSRPSDTSEVLQVTIARQGGGRKAQTSWLVDLENAFELTDANLPTHASALRYTVDADGFRKASLKVVSLATWSAGVVPFCRNAIKSQLPKKAKAKSGDADFECSLQLAGIGRHYIALYARPSIHVGQEASFGDDSSLDGDTVDPIINKSGDLEYGFEINVSGDCFFDIAFEEAGAESTLRIHVSCDETTALGCKSEFERLILLNRTHERRASSEVEIDRQARSSVLQSWILERESVRRSFLPLVLASDYAERWRRPDWTSLSGTVLSAGAFLSDPRPTPEQFVPPESYLIAREEVFARIRSADEDGISESALLGLWLATDTSFGEALERYVSAYISWLEAEPDVAAWSDTVSAVSYEQDGRTLQPEPDAVLLSPLHPLRLSWQAVAQQALYLAQKSKPCPAASVLDPRSMLDVLALPTRTADGSIKRQTYFSVETNSDYWGVLWNAARLDKLGVRGELGPFDAEFGLRIGGVSSGFSASQVERSLDDVVELLPAKPILSISVSSSTGQNTACNEGLISWCRRRFSDSAPRDGSRRALGRTLVQIFDNRRDAAYPQDAIISNLAEDTANSIRWFNHLPPGVRPDLGIIAQLDVASPTSAETDLASPVGVGALLRHRVRRQLSGVHLSETRAGAASPATGDVLADKVAHGLLLLENMGGPKQAYNFAPSIHPITDTLRKQKADFAAVSSASVDPACFLGGWLEDAYLWDYDLPSYSSRAGDTNGYYLLSQVRDLDREALGRVLARLPNCKDLLPDAVASIVFEVARRGIPTIRGLAAGDAGSSGDIGMFLAARILQDEFRTTGPVPSLLPVLRPTKTGYELSLVVPVDPFRGYLEDLRRAAGATSQLRPDLVVLSIRISGSSVRCRLTPIEVKYRGGISMSPQQCKEALAQASALSSLLSEVRNIGVKNDLLLWRLAFQHLLTSILGFGFRVYSQQSFAHSQSRLWASLHQQVVGAVFSGEMDLEIDQRGRLIVFDTSSTSSPRDMDGDGFRETIFIAPRDAASIVLDDAGALYSEIVKALGAWDLGPSSEEPYVQAAPETVVTSAESEAGSVDGAPLATSRTSVAEHGESQGEPEQRPEEILEAADDTASVETAPSTAASPESPSATQDAVGNGVELLVGTTVDGFRQERRTLSLSDTNLTQLNIGVAGDLGTGKTQLLKSLVYQVNSSKLQNRGVQPSFLIFDYKKDYASAEFVNAVGARIIQPHHLPLNLFDVSGVQDSQVPWLDRFKFFADVLDKIFSGIGPVQRQQLKQAVKQAYEDCSAMGRQPTIYDVHERYRAALGGKTDAPLAIIDDLVDMELFSPNPPPSSGFGDFLNGVVVISLASLGQDDRTKNMLVAIMLNLFYEHMLKIPKRPFVGEQPQLRVIDSFLMVDEADNIMRYEFDVLRKILLQGREFGVGVVLASQYLRHFKAGATDYREPLLSWFIHKVPNVTPQELGALGFTSDVALLAERVKTLPKHHCLFKTYGSLGDVVRGTPFYELMLGQSG